MKRKHKKYSKPKRPFNKKRIEEEAKLKKEFGLKNKREIWKAEAKINSIREKAKKMVSVGPKEQQALFEKLKKIGLKVNSLADVLSLDKKDYLKRRLQTIVVDKKIARTPKSARQLITHRKISVDGKIVNIPSYIVPVELESKISLKEKKKIESRKPSKRGEENEQEDKEMDKSKEGSSDKLNLNEKKTENE